MSEPDEIMQNIALIIGAYDDCGGVVASCPWSCIWTGRSNWRYCYTESSSGEAANGLQRCMTYRMVSRGGEKTCISKMFREEKRQTNKHELEAHLRYCSAQRRLKSPDHGRLYNSRTFLILQPTTRHVCLTTQSNKEIDVYTSLQFPFCSFF